MNMPQHSRFLFIDRSIKDGKYPNCSSLALEWEVSTKTIQRDIEYMRYELDAPIEYSGAKRGFFYTEDSFTLPALDIKESDLFAIYLAEKSLAQYEGTPIHDNLSKVFQKIADCLPDKIVKGPGSEYSRISFASKPSTNLKPGVWQVVFDGLKTLKPVKIFYNTKGAGETKSRLIEPYHGVRHEGDWYIIAYCQERQAIRTFSLARIERAEAMKGSYVIPADFDYALFSQGNFGIYGGAVLELVEIYFTSKVAPFIKERNWHESQDILPLADGGVVLTMRVGHLLELCRWVLSWGKDAKVIGPEKLREMVASEAKAVSLFYNN